MGLLPGDEQGVNNSSPGHQDRRPFLNKFQKRKKGKKKNHNALSHLTISIKQSKVADSSNKPAKIDWAILILFLSGRVVIHCVTQVVFVGPFCKVAILTWQKRHFFAAVTTSSLQKFTIKPTRKQRNSRDRSLEYRFMALIQYSTFS